MNDSPPPAPVYSRTSHVVATDVAGEIVLLNTENWAYYEFDQVGSAIWTLLETPQSLPALAQALQGMFAVDDARCLEETKTFLDDLIEQGLVAQT